MFDKLRKHKPLIHTLPPEQGGRLDPYVTQRKTITQVPVKWIGNTRGNMALQRLYTHGVLKYENTGRTCGNCVHFYPDAVSKTGGRCRTKGFSQVHPDWPAEHRMGFTDPVDGYWFRDWPECPIFILKERLSRR